MKYSIGDKVWCATWESEEVYEVCPDCCGNRFVTVIFGDNSRATVDCENCKRGWHGPLGSIYYHKFTARAVSTVVNRVELKNDGTTEYGTDKGYGIKGSELFDTEEEAKKRAMDIAEAQSKEDRARVLRKTHDNKSWAWNASYHRRCIKQAERDLEYHKAALDVARVKSREESTKGK